MRAFPYYMDPDTRVRDLGYLVSSQLRLPQETNSEPPTPPTPFLSPAPKSNSPRIYLSSHDCMPHPHTAPTVSALSSISIPAEPYASN